MFAVVASNVEATMQTNGLLVFYSFHDKNFHFTSSIYHLIYIGHIGFFYFIFYKICYFFVLLVENLPSSYIKKYNFGIVNCEKLYDHAKNFLLHQIIPDFFSKSDSTFVQLFLRNFPYRN